MKLIWSWRSLIRSDLKVQFPPWFITDICKWSDRKSVMVLKYESIAESAEFIVMLSFIVWSSAAVHFGSSIVCFSLFESWCWIRFHLSSAQPDAWILFSVHLRSKVPFRCFLVKTWVDLWKPPTHQNWRFFNLLQSNTQIFNDTNNYRSCLVVSCSWRRLHFCYSVSPQQQFQHRQMLNSAPCSYSFWKNIVTHEALIAKPKKF